MQARVLWRSQRNARPLSLVMYACWPQPPGWGIVEREYGAAITGGASDAVVHGGKGEIIWLTVQLRGKTLVDLYDTIRMT